MNETEILETNSWSDVSYLVSTGRTRNFSCLRTTLVPEAPTRTVARIQHNSLAVGRSLSKNIMAGISYGDRTWFMVDVDP